MKIRVLYKVIVDLNDESGKCRKDYVLTTISQRFAPTMNKQLITALVVGMITGFMVTHLLIARPQFLSTYSDPHESHEMQNFVGPASDPGLHNKDEEFHKIEDTSVANAMAQKVRILCWIMTGPNNHEKRARHVKNTWGKRCNILIFMSSQQDESLPSVALPVEEGRDNLWRKTKEAFRYVYSHHLEHADWFLKADDDTYVILENLRYMLYPHKPSEAVYYGCRFKPFVKQGYMSGGAGYVLSREAVKRFVEVGLRNSSICSPNNGGSEDVEMGKCMERLDVQAGDSRDSMGRGRFFPFVPEHHLIPGHTPKSFWYWKYIYYESKEGMDCCSDNAVSFHYVSPNQMYVLEYLIYHLRPYGITYRVEMPPDLEDHTHAVPNISVAKDSSATSMKLAVF